MKIVYFDYAAFALFIMLIASMWYKGLFKSRYNAVFVWITVIMFIATIFDIGAILGDNKLWGNIPIRYFSHIGYLFFHNITPGLYVVFLVSQSDTWHKLWSRWIFRDVFFLPAVLVAALIFTTPYSDLIFYIDDAGRYVRGAWFFVLYVQTIFYALIGIAYAIYYRKAFEKKRYLSLIMLYPMMLVSTIFQMIVPSYAVENFAAAFAVTYILFMVQRPEERMDVDAGLQNLSAFKADIARAEVTKKEMVVLTIAITNYEMIRSLISYEDKVVFQRAVAKNLETICKKSDVKCSLYYIGKGDFVICFSNRYKAKAPNVARLVNEALKENITINRMVMDPLAVVCLISYPQTLANLQTLITFIDGISASDYTGSVVYADNMVSQKSYGMVKDINLIIERGFTNRNFSMNYQPIYSVEERRFKSAEALIRLRDDEYGFVSPEIFIPAAEKNGTIYRIGDYVLEEVCSFMETEEYKKLGLDYIEVNLSAMQCMQDNMADNILAVLDRHGLSTSQINLEITETAAAYSQRAMLKNLNKLSAAGISFSLDDFGTGYSNLTRIATLPLSIIKLDKSFVNATKTERIVGMIENTVKMVKAMKYEIVVEGIETEDMLEWFAGMGCDFIQGYYFSKPLQQDDFVQFIESKAHE